MNKLIFFILFSIAMLTACRDDDTPSNPSSNTSIFADQDLQGTVFGTSWIISSGSLISINYGADPGKYLHIFTLRSESDIDICSKTNNGTSSFSLPGEKYLGIFLITENALLETGIYEFADAGSVGDPTFYFYDSTAVNTTSQVGSTGGSMLITKVDTMAGVVEGSLIAEDEEFDTNSSVNGNFTADYCRP